jgi:hypothetical protein
MRAFCIDLITAEGVSQNLSTTLTYSGAVDVEWTMEAIPDAFDIVLGTKSSWTVTFPAVAGATDGDFAVLYSVADKAYAVALDVDGTGVANAGPIWAAVPAAQKIVVDVSALTTAAEVAAAALAGLVTLAGFTADFTTADNTDGTVTVELKSQGEATPFVVKNAAEDGAGSVTVAEDTPGVTPTVNVATNVFTAVAHGLQTGMAVKVAIDAGSLPSPLVAATNYWVIRVGADSFKLASTRAFALVGTALDITTEGTDASTITVTPQANAASCLIEVSPDIPATDERTYRWRTLATVDLDGGTSPTTTAMATGVPFNQIRATVSVSSGVLSSVRCSIYGKNA